MIPFDLAEPKSLAEAIKLLDPDDATVRPIAGGTALMLMMKAGVFRPERLVSLRKIERKYSDIAAGRRRAAHRRHDHAQRAGALGRRAQARAGHHCARCRRLSNVRVRNVATVGGALAHGDPHMDLPPVLMALGATLTVVGPKGERKLAVEELFSGYYETVLDKNELISEVHVPAQGSKKAAYHEGHHRLGRRLAGARRRGRDRRRRQGDQVGAHRCERRDRQGHAAQIRRSRAERQERRATICSAQAGDAAAEEAEFIADVRGSVPYKRELMRVYVRRAVRAALNGNGAH